MEAQTFDGYKYYYPESLESDYSLNETLILSRYDVRFGRMRDFYSDGKDLKDQAFC